ncbi:type I-C CRISPR-associated protein Cas7/Csd2 [Plantactinospora sp. CA-290183]|uniref:type I-C CRISPR-associated protein Cas7/Csd2 n=1 Tax=Plantactinospora sp. CA-290183 TaxID=3240006 RepID=UPI003D8D9398
MSQAHLDPTRRHDAVLLFDVTDGNPNDDPDAQNQPRTDDESAQGLVTDVAIKRKIRDTVSLLRGDDPRYGVFVEAGVALNTRWAGARQTAADRSEDAVGTLCGMYYDARMFGAVLTAGKGAGSTSIRRPVQVTFARSIDPVLPIDHAITRVTQTRQEDIDKGERTELGSKWSVPYGLYRANVFFSAPRAAKTRVTSEDLATLWQALAVMFDHDRAATRGMMSTCGLWVFTHRDAYGVAQARELDRRIGLALKDRDKPPRSMDDYALTIDDTELPDGIELTTVVNLWL